MWSFRASRAVILPLLFGGLLVQSVVTSVPHRHEEDVVHRGPGLPGHWCSHATPEAFAVAVAERAPICLACAVPAPAFDEPHTTQLIINQQAAVLEPAAAAQRPTFGRRWSNRLRAPPSRV